MNLALGEPFGMNGHGFYTSQAGREAMMAWYDRRLALFTMPIHTQVITTRHGCTHILTAGNHYAPPILLLHGTNVSALGWQAQIEALAQDYYVIAPDVIGYAGKSDPVRLAYHDSGYADWVADVLEALHLSSAVIAGTSGGGFFALKVAIHYPQYVRGLALINPCGIVPFRFPLNIMRQPPIAYSVGFLSRRFGTHRLAYFLAKKNVAPDTEPTAENITLAHLLLKHYIRHHPPGAIAPHQLRHITAPILLLVSQHEPFFPPHHMVKRAKSLFSTIQTHVVDGAGHDIHVERPDFINQTLHHFIASLS
ncbi:MAG: alpha/beta hydrolase [bacterium]|nr:alpha/beta hydrolase [bacterium]